MKDMEVRCDDIVIGEENKSSESSTIQKCCPICGHEDCGTPVKMISTKKAKQFDFSRNWKKRIAPHLDHPKVVAALTLGMKLLDPDYEQGDPPWLYGRGPINGQRAHHRKLSWHQPWGRCHWIAPFVWALSSHIRSDLKWGCVSGKCHTVVIGYGDNWREPELIFDILQFKEMSAEDSLSMSVPESKFFSCVIRYISSFCGQPEKAMDFFCDPRKCLRDCDHGVGDECESTTLAV